MTGGSCRTDAHLHLYTPIGDFLTRSWQISASFWGMMWNLYKMLDLAPEASLETIVRAYRQHARASHPDARPDDPNAAARFRMLTSAYEVLSDPARRAHYDRTRPNGAARPLPQSGGYRPGEVRPTRTGEPPVGGKAPNIFLDGRPSQSSVPLWAGPVRWDAPPSEPVSELRLDSLISLLGRLLTDGWS